MTQHVDRGLPTRWIAALTLVLCGACSESKSGSPIAIASDGDQLCALSEAGTVSCMSLYPPYDDE